MKESVRMYALIDPKGRIIKDTVRSTKDDVWMVGFDHVSHAVWGFRSTYWHRWGESLDAAEKLGYIIKRVRVTVV